MRPLKTPAAAAAAAATHFNAPAEAGTAQTHATASTPITQLLTLQIQGGKTPVRQAYSVLSKRPGRYWKCISHFQMHRLPSSAV
jgi:hypothetical protein